jgi:hypothetical protein
MLRYTTLGGFAALLLALSPLSAQASISQVRGDRAPDLQELKRERQVLPKTERQHRAAPSDDQAYRQALVLNRWRRFYRHPQAYFRSGYRYRQPFSYRYGSYPYNSYRYGNYRPGGLSINVPFFHMSLGW